jgi:hypothetical protein
MQQISVLALPLQKQVQRAWEEARGPEVKFSVYIASVARFCVFGIKARRLALNLLDDARGLILGDDVAYSSQIPLGNSPDLCSRRWRVELSQMVLVGHGLGERSLSGKRGELGNTIDLCGTSLVFRRLC